VTPSLSGVIGTYFSIRNTKRSRERALAIRLAAFCWIWLASQAAWLFFMPRPWDLAAILLNFPILLLIPWMNRRPARARAEDVSGD
jgi:hypothetical protein